MAPPRRTLTCLFCALGFGLVGACGSRGPLDAEEALPAGGAADAQAADAAGDAAVLADATPDRGDARTDGGPVGPIACGLCVAQGCGAPILACVQNPSCARTFQCVTTSCVSGGTLDPACLVRCASGDPGGALQILQIFQCLTTKCGPDCASILGLLGGGGGGGAIDAGPRDAGGGPATDGGAGDAGAGVDSGAAADAGDAGG